MARRHQQDRKALGAVQVEPAFARHLPFVAVLGVSLLLIALVPWIAKALVS